MTCIACHTRVKDWAGDDPKCAFEGPYFSTDNWNCATAGAIRELISGRAFDERAIMDTRFDDESFGLIAISAVNLAAPAMALYVSWYKNRGRTSAMWLMNEMAPPRLPTEDDLRRIAQHFGLLRDKPN